MITRPRHVRPIALARGGPAGARAKGSAGKYTFVIVPGATAGKSARERAATGQWITGHGTNQTNA